MFQNNETAATLVFQTSSVGITEYFCYVNVCFYSNQRAPITSGHINENALSFESLAVQSSPRKLICQKFQETEVLIPSHIPYRFL